MSDLSDRHALPRAIARRLPFFYGWVVVGVAFVTMGLGANARGTFGLLFPPILAEFGWSRGDTSFIFSLGFLVAACLAPLLGYSIDRFGPNRVLPCGAILVALGFTLATYCSHIWQFFLTVGLLVISSSTMLSYNPHFIILPSWFERRRGLAIGAACTGVGTSAIVLFPWMQRTIDTSGWRTACFGMAALLAAILIPLNVLFQRRRPEDLGLSPDGDRRVENASEARPKAEPARVAAASMRDDRQVVGNATDGTLGQAMRTLPFWCVSGGFFCALFAWYAILVHQTKYLQDLGFSTQFASYALGLVPLFGVAGQIALGALSDRIGREWIWTLACVGFALCYALLIVLRAYPNPAVVWLMVLAQGGLGYSLVSVYGAIPADIFRGSNYGLIYGTMSFFGSLGASLGPFLLGRIHDWTGSYDMAFAIAICLSLLSIAFIWIAAPRRGQVAVATG